MWNVIHSAAQGRGHMASGLPCQDKTCTYFHEGCTVSALADGAGSAKLSHFGAERVTHDICEYVATHFERLLANQDGVSVKNEILDMTIQGLTSLSQELQCELKDLASTLLFVAIKNGRFLIGHIGDGVIGYVKAGKVLVASHPENGEFANTTIFTTSPNALGNMKLIKGNLGEISGFALMSDGTETSLYNMRKRALSPEIGRLLKYTSLVDNDTFSKSIQNVLENVIRKRTSDDCSLVLMSILQAAPQYYDMGKVEKCNFWNLRYSRANTKRIAGCESMLQELHSWKSPGALRQKLRLKKRRFASRLRRLISASLVQVREDGFLKATFAKFM